MSLGDLFPDDLKQKFAERNIDIGKSILIKIEDIDVNYPKYVIIVSKNNNEFLLAYVIINTEVNENVFPTPYLKSLHVLIDKQNHSFLDYDSYVNCSEIRTFNKQDIINFLIKNPERAVGNVSENVLKAIHTTISTARTIPKYLKDKFGF
ncbi:type II toxin-antitoxin system PemK/MazF family toxin [Aquimarina sp. ERC-38]|uniref:type II toxin-antitoxin system PemK/MazF family toxin n=1 Tax=Aquimarina sp. ERC-38 TaxID=2949996 RepID=UPI002247C647|nr:type II toxin-antitoxin system PemK/MazF family toxin [Aquimarina sp. ERC-38]UZO81511.1 type II toxin-antitoxin system PemK/MazF family toxin [Aquimarina sp. ERC-38]